MSNSPVGESDDASRFTSEEKRPVWGGGVGLGEDEAAAVPPTSDEAEVETTVLGSVISFEVMPGSRMARRGRGVLLFISNKQPFVSWV